MPLLPQEPSRQVALLVGIAALAAAYVLFAYWYEPQVADIEVAQARLSQLEIRNRQAQVVAARSGPDLDERLAVYQRHVERLEELIPGSEEVPTLMNSLTLEAQRAGVELTGLAPEAPEPGELYTLQSFGVSVVGDFHNIGRFLAAVASLPRIITPVDLVLEPFAGDGVRQEMTAPVTAQFRVQTYILSGGTAADGDPPAGGV